MVSRGTGRARSFRRGAVLGLFNGKALAVRIKGNSTRFLSDPQAKTLASIENGLKTLRRIVRNKIKSS